VLTNPRSERVRAVRALSRRSVRSRTGRFVVDGPQGVREAVRYAARDVLDLYVAAGAAARHEEVVREALAAGVHVHDVDDAVLAAMSETDAPQGLLAVVRSPSPTLADVLAREPSLLVLLASVRDPGNAGTVVRGADAAGADAVVVTGLAAEATLDALRAHGIRLLAADGAGGTLLPDADLTAPHAWVMGNEAWGLPATLRERCDDVVRVPIHGKAESLNLAMAATVCLYASAGVPRNTPAGHGGRG
jgi:TrmH family RNA methyltransferase